MNLFWYKNIWNKKCQSLLENFNNSTTFLYVCKSDDDHAIC